MKTVNLITFIVVLSCSFTITFAQKMTEQKKAKITIEYLSDDFPIDELNNKSWDRAKDIFIENYWSGRKAPSGRHFKARLLWSTQALYVRFEGNQAEPLIVSQTPNLKSKTDGLWNRDVCEIFVAPDKSEFRKYYEFEIAPNGEWVDLGVHQLVRNRKIDSEYNSGMKSTAQIEKDKVWMAIKIEWTAFNKTPRAGDIWVGNIFRCIGTDPDRGYLAWQATRTKTPNFHVPTAFGEFEFVK